MADRLKKIRYIVLAVGFILALLLTFGVLGNIETSRADEIQSDQIHLEAKEAYRPCFRGTWATSERVYFYVNMSAHWELVNKPYWVRSTTLENRNNNGYVVYRFSPKATRVGQYASSFRICAR